MEEQQIIDDIAPTKKGRQRKKLLYNSIKEQMEFYFSNVNVSKDRYIAQLLQQDDYIDLSVFLQFNKIRRLTTKISDLCKAILKSEILELSENNLKVRCKTPIIIKENEDECTIYVERLPADTEHEWLQNLFSKFGPVDYVSIPRYKHNKKIKGFAFIEFKTPEIAKKALEYFESIGSKLPTTMLPDKLASISTFDTEKLEKSQNINKFTNDTQCTSIESETKPKNKRKESDELKETNEKKKMKKHNTTVEETETSLENISNDLMTKESKKKEKDNQKQNEECEGSEVAEKKNLETNETTEIKNKKKKKQEQKNDVEETENPEINETKKKMKKKQEQDNDNAETENMETNESADTKKKKRKIRENENELKNEEKETDCENDKVEGTEEQEQKDITDENETGERRKRRRKKNRNNTNDLQQYGLQVLSKKEWKQLRNKYLNLQRQKMQSLKEQLYRNRNANAEDNDKEVKSAPRYEFSPGAIVRITFRDQFSNVNKFKSEIRSQPGLQYVDVKIGNNVGYIRFSDNASAKKFSELENINGDMVILEGNEEKEYWNTILQSREEKLKKESKKQRGRDKLLRKAEKDLGKHIRFEAE